MSRRSWPTNLFLALTPLLLIAGACAAAPEPQVVEKEVVVTQIVEKEVEKVVEKEVEKEVEVVVTATPSGEEGADSLTVFSLWGGAERDAFLKVLEAFRDETGIVAFYEQGRDFEAVLRPRIAAGNPPDVAIIPRPGAMAAFFREGAILPLTPDILPESTVQESYSQGWIDLGTVDGQFVGLPAKANSKTVMWYRPDLFTENGWETVETWEDYIALLETIRTSGAGVAPLAIGAGDGWTLTDWWENITLRGFGPDLYDQIVAHEIAWTDDQVGATFETFGEVIRPEENIVGGADGALATRFVDGITQVFGPNPQAAMYYEGGFVGGIAMGDVNPDLVIGETIDFFVFPSIDPQYANAVVGAGDLAIAFRDTPAVRAFVQYIASRQAGEVWVADGTIISPNKAVPLGAYPNQLAAQEAEQLQNAEFFRFDGSDLMPSGIGGDQLFIGLQDFLADPDSLDQILEDLEARAQLEY